MLACWENDPNKRPTIQQVAEFLAKIIVEKNNENNSTTRTENKKELSSIIYPQSTIMEAPCTHSKASELLLNKLIQDYNLEYNSDILNQAEKLFLEIFDIADAINIL